MNVSGRNPSPQPLQIQEKQVHTQGDTIMKSLVVRLHKDEAGQGLVEYALIVALIGFAAVVGMDSLATDINNAFNMIGNFLTTTIP